MKAVKGGNKIAENPMKEQLAEWKAQVEVWKDRIQFLKDWNVQLTIEGKAEINKLKHFELMNKVQINKVEIEAKENVIEKRGRDLDRSMVMISKQMKELEQGWNKTMTDLQIFWDKNQEILTPEYKNLVKGIIKRSKVNQYKNGQQQHADMQLAQNIMTSQK